jgi:predicted metal-dependent phosphoesterase TrpH
MARHTTPQRARGSGRVADLHLHTTASDGCWSPGAVVRALAKLGFAAAAITDHDEVSGIPQALEAGRECGIEIVPAVELSTAVPAEPLARPDGRTAVSGKQPENRSGRAAAGEREVHILGYYIDCDARALHEVLEACRTYRRRRMHTMVEKLAEVGVGVEFERVQELAGDGAIGRPHLARAMVEAGHVGSIEEAFARYLTPGRVGYAPKWKMTPSEACALIRRIGGVPVLAHPMLLKDDALVASIINDGVMGIEAYYSYCRVGTTEHYVRMAEENGLLVTGGSDCHQSADGLLMGRVRLPYERVEALRARWEALKKA